jgi:hypothetical protein
MLKDKIIEIVRTLTHLTESGVLKWDEDTSTNHSREYKRKMLSGGEDGTKYEMEIKFVLKNEDWKIEDDASLWIKNTKLPDTMMLVTSLRSDGETINLRSSVIKNFCKDMSPSIDYVENILSDIARGINITEFREGKLNKILN